ncbi:rRNA biogenesis protein rrp36 [Lachnellula suecica]|uniref:rRNA biogenesis protein RRP36 n=1 Tax=Lachnellula suecica TaxID=602035 RepID=A0A8T9BWD4_9HELO|nr:rRNA biogenesis protein rrp36 [Lachnellula suecica]
MSSTKRKNLDGVLGRRVRARREPSVEVEEEQSAISDGPATNSEDNSEEQDSDDESNSSSEDEDPEPEAAALISFGALAKASESLTGARKKKQAPEPSADDGWANNEALERKAGRKDHRDFNRSNKHAPTEISSKKAVSRRREVVPVPKREVRDPRFEPATGPVDDAKVRKAYAFLDGYREDEMKELRGAIRNERDEDKKERMKRALGAMENRKKAQERKDREEAVLEKHRKEEKELVKQGKQPFYLKKKEVDKRVLVDTFGELKGKKLDRVIERRRKKVEGKEKKKMPFARRVQE